MSVPPFLRHRAVCFGILLAVTAAAPHAQVREGVLPIDDPVQRFLQRQQAAGHLPGELLTALPLSAYEANRLLDSVAVYADALPTVDRALLARYRGEMPGPGVAAVQSLIPGAYRDGEALVAVDGDGYALRVQPLAYLTLAPTRQTARGEQSGTLTAWQNTRGIRVGGHVGPIFFETRLEENQRKPVWDDWSTFTAPRLNFVKHPGNDTYDYWRATGVVGYQNQFFDVRFGRDSNHWGFGEGSLALSDFSAPQDQLQIRTRFWRLQYTNLFTRRVRPVERTPGTPVVYPRNWSALHQLALDLPGGVQAELFEITLFADDSLNGRRDGFEVSYLNPLIFYRAVEADVGTPDNVMLGAGLAWQAAPGYRLYSQLLLDELRLREIGNDWWANKWGYLLGAQISDPGVGAHRVPGLDLRLEYTRQRPYLYSHRHPSTAYLHSGDLIGHPAGPNSWDLAAFARYRPIPRAEAALNIAYTRRGRNTATENFGSDPSLSYDSRVSNDGVVTLQGIQQNQMLVEGRAGYEVLPGLVLEGVLRYEALDDAELGLDRYLSVGGQLRWGLPYQSVRY